MAATNTSLPGFSFNGVQDLSTRKQTPPALVQPQHFPIFMIRSPKGDDVDLTLVIDYNDAVAQLGADTFDQRKPYYNHQTKALELALQSGNACWVKRITTTGSGNNVIPLKKSTVVILATIENNVTINQYARNGDGTVIYDANTNLPTYITNNGAMTPVVGGLKVRFDVVPEGQLSIMTLNSTIVSWDNSTGHAIEWSSNGNTNVTWVEPAGSVTYALAMFESTWNGTDGNNFGFKMWTANGLAPFPMDPAIIDDQQAIGFNFQIVQNVGTSTAMVVPTINGDPLIPFMFKPNAYNKDTNFNLTIQNIVDKWKDDGLTAGTSPTYGPIGKVTVFENNLETFLNRLFVAETANNPNPPATIWELDFLTGTTNSNVVGVPTLAYGFQIDTNGPILSANNSFFLSGGQDGSLTDLDYETAIQSWIMYNFDNEASPCKNILKYPFSDFYDTGFTSNTKKVLPMVMGYRKNTSVHLATHVDGHNALSHQEEISISSVLQQQLLDQAESVVYSTPAYRGTLTLQSGFLLDNYPKRVPLIFELLIKRCKMMGAGNGQMSTLASNDYTLDGNNQIQYFKSISAPNFNVNSAKEAWYNGAIFSMPSGMGNQYFYPYIHTVYPNATSVLTSDIVRHICAHIATVQAKLWVKLVGRDDLDTQEKFISESNKLFTSMTANIFAGKVNIISVTDFTPSQIEDGYSWTHTAQVEAGTVKNVAVFNVVANRIKTVN